MKSIPVVPLAFFRACEKFDEARAKLAKVFRVAPCVPDEPSDRERFLLKAC